MADLSHVVHDLGRQIAFAANMHPYWARSFVVKFSDGAELMVNLDEEVIRTTDQIMDELKAHINDYTKGKLV